MIQLADKIPSFSGQTLVVLGDLVADEYLHGTTSRISREAPVLIVAQDAQELRPGGAANVVANLCALGGQVRAVGLVGDDAAGVGLRKALAACGADCAGVATDPQRFTTAKTRILAGGANTVRQQMLRIDRLNREPVGAPSLGTLLAYLERALRGAGGLVVSDYGEGVVEGPLFARVLEVAQAGRVPVFVDSRYRIARFLGADTLTPNEPELQAAADVKLVDPPAMERAGRWLQATSACRRVLLKRGRNGMALFDGQRPTQTVAAFGPDEVADVTGAGDTVLAAWALARVSGASPAESMIIANAAGGIKITKSGTAVVRADELARALAASDPGHRPKR